MTTVDSTQIVFDTLAQDQWRILDGRLEEGDIAALLGFVEIVAGVYEVMLFSDPATPRFCACLDDVRSEIAADDAPYCDPALYEEQEL